MNFEFQPSVFILSVESWDKKISFRGEILPSLIHSKTLYFWKYEIFYKSALNYSYLLLYVASEENYTYCSLPKIKPDETLQYMGTTVTACVICFLQCLVAACVIYFLPCLLVSCKHQIGHIPIWAVHEYLKARSKAGEMLYKQ